MLQKYSCSLLKNAVELVPITGIAAVTASTVGTEKWKEEWRFPDWNGDFQMKKGGFSWDLSPRGRRTDGKKIVRIMLIDGVEV